ncbi:MAG: hypothetical protein Q7S87_18860 [Agitococcus sp.]|nr:hypothetical protein [Agitococcus sp.]
MKKFTLMMATALVATSSSKADIRLVLEPSPQSYSNSCQSYGLAYLLGTAPNSPFSVSNPMELRVLEKDIRAKIEATALSQGISPTKHSVWKQAISEYTSKAYTFREQAFGDKNLVAAKVEELTGVSTAGALPVAISSVITPRPVMVSFKRVGANKYVSGHIVVVLGTDAGRNEKLGFLMLNEAVIGPDNTKIACNPSDPSPEKGDSRYRAITSVEKDYELTSNSVIWLEKN